MVDVSRWRNFADRAFLRLQAAVWPPICVLCGDAGQAPAHDLCVPCEAELPVNSPCCSICAEPLEGEPAVGLRCGACLRRPPLFDKACCAFRYAHPVDHLVRGLKYHAAVAQGRVLGELLARRLAVTRSDALPELLIPVPLAGGRYRERGYNQAIELARYVEKRLGVELRTDLVERTRETPEQAGLGKNARRRNIRGAFAMLGKLSARHVAIVDDVITTGSTVNELAKVLKRAGATRVEAWAVARAGR